MSRFSLRSTTAEVSGCEDMWKGARLGCSNYREFVDVYLFTRPRSQILEGRLITHVCIEGNYKFLRLPVVFPYSCARRRSSQPQSPLRLASRSQMFRKLWLACLSALQTFLN